MKSLSKFVRINDRYPSPIVHCVLVKLVPGILFLKIKPKINFKHLVVPIAVFPVAPRLFQRNNNYNVSVTFAFRSGPTPRLIFKTMSYRCSGQSVVVTATIFDLTVEVCGVVGIV